jgi:hypothetical protein
MALTRERNITVHSFGLCGIADAVAILDSEVYSVLVKRLPPLLFVIYGHRVSVPICNSVRSALTRSIMGPVQIGSVGVCYLACRKRGRGS